MKFKKILSAALAAVMAASVMSIGMVSVASAADGDAFTLKAEDLDASKLTDKKLTINGATVAISNTSNALQVYGTYAGDNQMTNTTGKTFTNELKTSGGRDITITPAASGTVTVYWYDGGSKEVTVGGKQPINAPNYTVTSESDVCTAGTDFVINLSSSNIALLEIDFEPGNVTTYTINGTSNLAAEDTFTIGEYAVTVKEGGAWSITTGNELKAGDILPISKGGYTVSPESVTLEGSSPFNVGELTFTEKNWDPILEGDYTPEQIAAGHPYFDLHSEDYGQDPSHPERFIGTIKMNFSSAATVTITGHCPSTTTTKSITIKLGDLNETRFGTDPASSDEDFVAHVDAGVQTLVITTNSDTKLAISNLNVKYDGSAEPPVDDGNANITIGQVDNQYVVVGVDKPENCGDIQLYAINSASEDAQAVIDGNHPVGVSIDTVYQAVTGIAKEKIPVSGYVFAQEVANGNGTYTFAAKSADGKTSGTVQITQSQSTTPGGGDNGDGVSAGTTIDPSDQGLLDAFTKDAAFPYAGFEMLVHSIEKGHIVVQPSTNEISDYISFKAGSDASKLIVTYEANGQRQLSLNGEKFASGAELPLNPGDNYKITNSENANLNITSIKVQ